MIVAMAKTVLISVHFVAARDDFFGGRCAVTAKGCMALTEQRPPTALVPNPLNHKGTETQKTIHGEDPFGQVLLCALVALWRKPSLRPSECFIGSTRRFDKLKAPSEVEGLTLAATRNTSPVSAFSSSVFQRFPPATFGFGIRPRCEICGLGRPISSCVRSTAGTTTTRSCVRT
jgi:hypothetical protein